MKDKEPLNRLKNGLTLVGWALVGVGILWWYGINPLSLRLLPACLIRTTTGFYCPGCGMTRAVIQLIKGHPDRAIRFNPLIMVLIGVGVYWIVKEVSRLIRGHRWIMDSRLRVSLFWILLSLTLLFGMIRNIPLYPFTMLAPP